MTLMFAEWKRLYVTINEALASPVEVYMESDSGATESFSFNKFMLDQDVNWHGPFVMVEDNEDSDG